MEAETVCYQMRYEGEDSDAVPGYIAIDKSETKNGYEATSRITRQAKI